MKPNTHGNRKVERSYDANSVNLDGTNAYTIRSTITYTIKDYRDGKRDVALRAS